MPEIKNRKRYTAEQPRLDGGVVSTVDPAKIEVNQLQRMVNAYPSRDGSVVKRKGFELIKTLTDINVRASRMFLSDSGGTDKLITWTNHDVNEYDPASGVLRILAREWMTGPTSSPGLTHCMFQGAIYFSEGLASGRLDKVSEAAAAQKATVHTGVFEDADGLNGSVDIAGSAGNDYDLKILNTAAAQALSVGLAAGVVTVEAETQADVQASVVWDSTPANSEITVTAKDEIGASGNGAYEFTVVNGGVGQSLAVASAIEVGGVKQIQVNVETDGAGVALSTAAQIVAALELDASANAWCSFVAEGTGAGVTRAVATGSFVPADWYPTAGGIDESTAIVSTWQEITDALNADGTIGALITWTVRGTGSSVAAAQALKGFTGGAEIGDLYVSTVNSDRGYTYLATRFSASCIFGIDADDLATIRWCDASDPTTWGALSLARPGGEFTSLLEIGRSLVLTQRDRLFRIDGTDPTTWELTSIASEGLGCTVPFSMLDVEGVATYFSPRGLAIYPGSRPTPISDAIWNYENLAMSILPHDDTLVDASFSVQSYEFCWFFYKSVNTKNGCDRAVVFDFRRGVFGGPYHLGFEATSGWHDLSHTGDTGALYLGTYAGQIIRMFDEYTDLDAAYEMDVAFATVDAGSPVQDKIYRSVRLAVTADGAGTLTVAFIAEDETSARTNATRNFTLSSGNYILEMALPAGLRAFKGYVEVQNSDDIKVELSSEAVDLFFVPRT